MKQYQLQLRMDREFDSMNRVLNKFCGRGFVINEVDFLPDKDQKSALMRINLLCDVQSLTLIAKKLVTYIDVYQILEMSEIKQLNVI